MPQAGALLLSGAGCRVGFIGAVSGFTLMGRNVESRLHAACAAVTVTRYVGDTLTKPERLPS
jgi:hypothetical protein